MQTNSIQESTEEIETEFSPFGERKTLMLVDGSNLAFRMYFALERTAMTSPHGKPSWAIFGFFKALFDVIETYKPTTVISAFDTKGPTFRHEAFDFYKANRPTEMPDALALQWPEIKKGLELVGMSLMEMPGYEADDLIGTLSLQAENSGWNVLILSGDKDNFQLVSDRVKVLMPGMKGIQLMGRDEVKAKMGVYPEQVVDYKSLCGDNSDNIPGVLGIGEKTTVKLLEEYGSLDEILGNIENLNLSVSLKKKLSEGIESARDSQFLAQIKTDCPIAYPFDQLTHPLNPNIPELISFLREYKLANFERRLPKIFTHFDKDLVDFKDLNDLSNKLSLTLNFDEASSGSNSSGSSSVDSNENSSANNPLKPSIDIERNTIFTEAEFAAILKEISESNVLSLDLETDGLNTWECNIVGWSFGWQKGNSKKYYSAYIPTGHIYLGAPDQLSNDFVSKSFQDLFDAAKGAWKGQLIIQNIKFEYKILVRYGLTLPKGTLDTMLSSYLADPDASHGLKNQTLRIFKYQMANIDELIGPKGKSQKTMDQVPIEKAVHYACDDAAFTLALYDYYNQTLDEKLKKLWIEVESPLALFLSRMELAGIYINAAKLEELSKDLTKKIVLDETEILDKLGADSLSLNLNSTQQLGQALAKKGFQLKKSTGSGQLSTDSKILYELRDQDETGLIDRIIDFRGLSKLRSTYTDSLPRQINAKTGRVHGEFNQALTSTGRLSSSNPNLQNIPAKNPEFSKRIRSAFEAETGNLLISADYSQIELRILAHYTEDPILVDAFQKGQDIHSRTASEIFEVAPENVTSEMRRLGKTLNFALIYQQGPQATAKQLGISNKEASQFIEKYFARFPKVRPFIENTINEAREKGYVETIWGRRRYFRNLNSKIVMLRKGEERAAFNAPLQGSAADMMKIAMLRVSEKIEEANLGAKIVLQVHDEIVLEAAKEQIELVKDLVKKEMVLNQPLKVPIVVDAGIGSNWAECK
jgi:DNA polymerase-1